MSPTYAERWDSWLEAHALQDRPYPAARVWPIGFICVCGSATRFEEDADGNAVPSEAQSCSGCRFEIRNPDECEPFYGAPTAKEVAMLDKKSGHQAPSIALLHWMGWEGLERQPISVRFLTEQDPYVVVAEFGWYDPIPARDVHRIMASKPGALHTVEVSKAGNRYAPLITFVYRFNGSGDAWAVMELLRQGSKDNADTDTDQRPADTAEPTGSASATGATVSPGTETEEIERPPRVRPHGVEESKLAAHARRELDLIGQTESDPRFAEAIVGAVEAFARYGHSGGSASAGADFLDRLLRFKPLSALTSDPGEWVDVSEQAGYPLWQNNRDSRFMSEDGGESWYRVGKRNRL